MKHHEPKVPAIEPPCEACVAARTKSGDAKALCARHAERHAEGHGYSYRREIPLATHDSNVVPTGVDSSRVR